MLLVARIDKVFIDSSILSKSIKEIGSKRSLNRISNILPLSSGIADIKIGAYSSYLSAKKKNRNKS